MDQYTQKCGRNSGMNDKTPVHTSSFMNNSFADDSTYLYPKRGDPKDAQPRYQRYAASKASRPSSQNSSQYTTQHTTYERFLEVPSSRRSIFIRQRQRKRSAIIVGAVVLLFLGIILWAPYCRRQTSSA